MARWLARERGDDFEAMRAQLARGQFTDHMRIALTSDEILVVRAPKVESPDCPLAARAAGCAALVHRLAFGGKVFGLLVVSLPAEYAEDIEEQGIFIELAGDLAYALYTLALAQSTRLRADQLSSIQALSLDGYWLIDVVGRLLDVNDAYCRMSGYSREELLARTVADLEGVRSPAEVEQHLLRARDIGHDRFETRHRAKDGRVYDVEVSGYYWADARGFVVFIRDIGERKQAEATLRESEEKYRILVENAGEAVFVVQDGIMQFANPRSAEISGWSLEELLSRPFTGFVHADDREMVMDRHLKRQRGEELPDQYALRIVRPDGEMRWVELNAVQIEWEGRPATLNFLSDITERKHAETRLAESEQQYRTLFETAPVGIFRTTSAGEVICANPEMARMLGCETPAEAISHYANLGSTLYVDAGRRDRVMRLLREAGTVTGVEFQARRVDGEVIWLSMNAHVAERRSDGSFILEGFATDVSERKSAEDALLQSREQFELAVDGSQDGIWDWDLRDNCLFLSRRWKEMLGYGDDELPNAFSTFQERLHPTDESRVMESVEQYLHGTIPVYSVEFQMRHKDGSYRWILARGATLRDENGVAYRMAGSHTDITDRKTAEEALRQSERRVRQRLDAILLPEGDLGSVRLADIIDAEAVQTMMDDFYALTGIGVAILDIQGERLVATGWQDICTQFHRVHPDSNRNCLESDTQLSRGVKPGEFKVYKCRNNMWDIATPIVVGGEHLGNLFLGQFFFEDEQPDHETFRTQAQSYGFDEDAYLSALDRVPRWSRETIDQVMAFYARLSNLLSTLSYSNIKLARTLTERQRMEMALRESEARYRSYVENAPYGVFIVDETGRYLDVNPAACQITGYSESELLSMGIPDIVAPDYRNQGMSHFEQLLQEGWAEGELPFQHESGEIQWWSVVATQLSENRFLGFTNDVTERRRSEERLRLMADMLDVAPSSITVHDFTGRFLYANDRSFILHGYAPDEFMALNLCDVDVPESAELIEERMQIIDEQGEALFEVAHFHKDGSRIPMEVYVKKVEWAGTPAVLSIGRDITERKRAEEEQERLQSQLVQAQKMEAVGRLAGGVAHDFNNMLQSILGYSSIALREVRPGGLLHESLSEIQKAGQRSADLTRQLLAFARRQTIAPKVLDLNDTVAGMLKMLRRLIGEGIDLAWMPGANLWNICIDPSQVDQILANLMVNARDAMHGRGRVTIETRNFVPDAGFRVEHPEFQPGQYVSMMISDDGSGMDEGTMSNIFDPFFTTKEEGRGTGLGLATVYGIVKQNEGYIHVTSELGVGSRFCIYLPRADGVATTEEKAETEIIPGGQETVLLVEDEQMILNLGRRLLAQLGYQVLTASTPAEALRRAGEHEGGIDLLLTDVVMPEMNGRELAEQLRTTRSEMKCLFMSGYTADVIAVHGVLHERVEFLQKPFSVDSLAAKVREVLDG